LMVLCTVRRISADATTPALPQAPKPFMDKGNFDSKIPGDAK
jgi:hypothetical protein